MAWKVIKDGELVMACEASSLPSVLLNFIGDDVVFRIVKDEIHILEAKWEKNHGQAVSEGMMKKNIEKYREEGNYISKAGYKYCTNCKQSKQVSEFGKRSNSKDGLARQCKECVTKKAKKYRKRKAREITITPLPVEEDMEW